MTGPKTLGVLVQKIGDDPAAFRAGVVWGAMPFLYGTEEAPTAEAAVALLEERARRLGHEPAFVLFDTLEAAQVECRRRMAAEDLLRQLDPAGAKLPEVLAGGRGEPDARDREVLDELDRAIRAVRAVATGAYDEEKRATKPPVRDGRICCPSQGCDPDYPEAYFTATADALATARLSPTGGLHTWRDVSVSEEGYREVRCGSCGADLGDLSPEDLEALGPDARAKEG